MAIHQAFTAYDRVFQDHESYSASPPFQSLIQQLQQLRMISLNQNISSPIFSPSITSADSSAEKRHVYQKHEICQLRGILGDIEVPPAVQSYQSIVHIPESPPIKRNSNKKSQNKKKSSGFSPNSATSDRQNWSSPVGRSLDNILNEAVGHDHYIVSDRSSEIVEQSRILSSTEDHDDGEVGSS